VIIPSEIESESHSKNISDKLQNYFEKHPENLSDMTQRQEEYYKNNPSKLDELKEITSFALYNTSEGRNVTKYFQKLFI
ncbi:hypothetical protein IJ670_03620, partial [bacterium]|nr:hypothetical protein [bacterium]